MPGKNTEEGDVGQATELGLCQPARTPGRSHLLHPVVHSLVGQADDCKGESQSPGRTRPWVNFHLSKHTGKQAHAKVIFPWKTLDWPHLCRARTPVMLQGHFQATDCAIISPCPPWASSLPGDRRGKKGDTREWLRKSSTHLWPLPVGVNSFDVQRDGFYPATCRREHREMERLSEKPRSAGCSTPEPYPSPRGGTSQTPRHNKVKCHTYHRPLGSASTLCEEDTSGRAFRLQRKQSRKVRLPHPLSKSRFGHLPQHLKLSHTKGIHFPVPAWTGTPILSLQSSICHPSSSRINPSPTRVVELTCTFVQEVSKETAHDRLVTDHKDILLSLQLHDDRL